MGRRFVKVGISFVLAIFSGWGRAWASGESLVANLPDDMISRIHFYATGLIWPATIFLIIFSVISLILKPEILWLKRLLFWPMVIVIAGTTLAMMISTIYLNQISWSHGPVHWHADYEVWDCGTKLNLIDPASRFSNKVGTPTLHEHNDGRIHIEGVVVNPEDISLAHFFEVVGGKLTNNSAQFPINAGLVLLDNNHPCPDMPVTQLQVFLYHISDGRVTQEKLTNPAEYVPAHFGQIPPGDCIIVELDQPKTKTDKLCRSYEVAKITGKIQ